MKKHVKTSLLLLSGLAATAALASCGTTGGYVLVEVPTSLPAEGSDIELVFWHCLGHDKEEMLQTSIVDRFNEKYKGYYHVRLVKLAGDYDSLSDAVRTKLSSGEVPALTMGYPDNFSTYMGSNYLTSATFPLDDFIKSETVLSNGERIGYTQDEISDFVPAFYNEGSDYQFEGQWSMPMYKSTEVMYYNASYFAGANPQSAKKLGQLEGWNALYAAANSSTATEEALSALRTFVNNEGGYTYNVPSTWEEMIATSRQILTDRKTEKLNDEFIPFGYDSDSNLMITSFAMKGIPYTTNDNISAASDHILFNNAEAKAFTQEIVDLYREGILVTRGILGGDKYTNEYFNQNKMPMTVGSTGGSSYQVSSNFKVDVAPVPTPDGVEHKYIQQGPSIAFFNNGDNDLHLGAWLFYKELASTDNNAELALQNSYDPVRLSSYDTDMYKDWIALKDRELKYLIPATTSTLREHYTTSAVFNGSDAARDSIGQILSDVVASNYTIDQAFQNAYNATVAKTH